MSDSIGPIQVPDSYNQPSLTFPLVTRYPWSYTVNPKIVVHQFGSRDAKTEQRFYIGDGEEEFVVNLTNITPRERDQLRSFWLQLQGPYQCFYYNAPRSDGSTIQKIVRFDNAALQWQQVNDFLANASVKLIGMPRASSTPAYAIANTYTRFPSADLVNQFLAQTQQFISLVTITPRGYPGNNTTPIRVSDRRCNVGGVLYQARLLQHQGISQQLGPADDATFTFGNADRVMTQLSNSVNLIRADVQFCLYHVASQTLGQIWRGEVKTWKGDEGSQFSITCSDSVYELTLPYPARTVDRYCWKTFNDGYNCPYSSVGSGGNGSFCDKGFDTASGCQSHGMDNYFGGVIVDPQGVLIRDNSQSGRPHITATSIVSDSLYGTPLQEIYTNIEMPVNCTVAAVRDEGEFLEALGIVGAGPIGSFGNDINQLLDGQPQNRPYAPGENLGGDPNGIPFSLDAGGQYQYNYKAAGVARLIIRRTDTSGIQPTTPDQHTMTGTVLYGLLGNRWSGPNQAYYGPLTNPVWIAVNALIRSKGLTKAPLWVQEQHFDLNSAIAAGQVCEHITPTLVYNKSPAPVPTDATNKYQNVYTPFTPQGPQEIQFSFHGVIADSKPLRDWIDEILLNCCGFWSTVFGKLQFGIRSDADSQDSFQVGNIIFNSLSSQPVSPEYNDLTATFADQDYNFEANTMRFYDETNAEAIGGLFPRHEKGTLNLVGTSTASQALRIAATRCREELGGAIPAEWVNARTVTWKTTVLGLHTQVGEVVDITHPDLPGGVIKARITQWVLNWDYSIQITARTVTDSMYAVVYSH